MTEAVIIDAVRTPGGKRWPRDEANALLPQSRSPPSTKARTHRPGGRALVCLADALVCREPGIAPRTR